MNALPNLTASGTHDSINAEALVDPGTESCYSPGDRPISLPLNRGLIVADKGKKSRCTADRKRQMVVVVVVVRGG